MVEAKQAKWCDEIAGLLRVRSTKQSNPATPIGVYEFANLLFINSFAVAGLLRKLRFLAMTK